MISRTSLLANKPKTDTVTLNGDTLHIRELTGEEGIQFALRQKAENKPVGYALSVACQDEAGQPLFTADDIDDLAALPFSIAQPIAQKILELSGMAQKDDAEKKPPATV